MRATVALVALVGFLGTAALGAATAVHVALEHDTPRPTALTHHSHGAHATEDAHSHEADVREQAAEDGIERDQGLGHQHPLALLANAQARAARSAAGHVATGVADAPTPPARAAERSSPGPISRAGPAAWTAPLSRRSVVLQV